MKKLFIAIMLLSVSLYISAEDCAAPSSLQVTNLTQTSVTLRWSAVTSQSSWRVYLKKASEGEYQYTYTSNKVKNLAGLEPNTTYDVQIVGVCGSESLSDPLNGQFTTLAPCEAPTDLGVMNNITETTATIYWTSNEGSSWHVTGTMKGTSDKWELDSDIQILDLTDLIPGTEYVITVQTRCSDSELSEPSEPLEFATLATCPEPTTLQVFSAKSNSTSLAVGIEAEGSTAFNLQWKKRNSTEDWSIGSTGNGEALITGLEPNTEYQICAATACENGSTSSFICLIITTAMPEDKTALAAELEEANALYNYGLANDVTAEEMADLNSAIETMTAVMGNEHASQTQINDAYVLGSSEFIKAANEIIVPKILALTNESYASIAQEGDREDCLELIYNALDVAYGVTWDFGKTVAQNAALIEDAIGYNSYLQLKAAVEDCRKSDPSEGIEDVQSDNVQCHKVLKDGSLFIKRGARVYNVLGTIVK